MRSIDDLILTKWFMWKKFDAKSNLKVTRKIRGNKKSKKAIIFFPYWTGKSEFYKRLSKDFKDFTLVFYDYPNEIMSKNIQVSNKYNREILIDSFNLVLKLRERGYKEISLVGSSSGANFALKLSTMARVEKVVLNMIDKNISTQIFESPALKFLKKTLEKRGITRGNVNRAYSFMSTEYLLKSIAKTNSKFLILLSKNDIFCPFKDFEPLLSILDKEKVKYEVHINKVLGHVASMYWNVFVGKRIQNFIKK